MHLKNLIALFLIAGAGVSGCATTPDPWQDLTVETTPAATPLDCGSFPMPQEVVNDTLVYTNDGANDLEAYRACSEANEAIAREHALQIGQLKTSRAHLVEAGQAQRNIAEMRQEMLEDERRHNFFMTMGYWLVIIGLGSAL